MLLVVVAQAAEFSNTLDEDVALRHRRYAVSISAGRHDDAGAQRPHSAQRPPA